MQFSVSNEARDTKFGMKVFIHHIVGAYFKSKLPRPLPKQIKLQFARKLFKLQYYASVYRKIAAIQTSKPICSLIRA